VESAVSADSPDSYLSGAGLAVLVLLIGISVLTVLFFFLSVKGIGRCAFSEIPLIIPSTLLSLAFLMNGVGAVGYTPKNLGMGIFEIAGFFLFFYLFYFGLRRERADFLIDRFCFLSALTVLLISLEILWLYATSADVFMSGSIVKESIVFGWGIWNTAGSMLSVLIPACFLGAMRSHRRWIYLGAATLAYISAVMTLSRGALLVSTFVYFLSFAILLNGKKSRYGMRYFIFGALFVGLAAMLLFGGKILELFKDYFDRGLSDNGRFALWRAGLSDFLSSPLFGRGFFGVSAPDDFASELPGMLHSTPIQLLAATGLFGFISYVCYRVSTLKKVFRSPSLVKSMLALSVFAIILGSLLDNFIFYMHQMIYPSLALALICITDKSD
jgi:O-antigen ligase